MNHRLGTVSKNTGEHVICTITTLNSDVEQNNLGVQWLSGRALDYRPRGHGLEPHRRHCVVILKSTTHLT